MQFVLTLSEYSKDPLYLQVYESIRDSILQGRLRFGERLPSTRELSDVYDISRFTVIRSYELLTAQGFIETIMGSGTFVRHKTIGDSASVQSVIDASSRPIEASRLTAFGQRLMRDDADAIDSELFDELNYGAPSVEDLPLKAWREVLHNCSRFQDKTLFQYVSDPMGYAHLREAIVAYLNRSRSTKANPDRIAVFSGSQSALDLVCRLLINPGDCVAVEDPGSLFPRRTFKIYGAKVVPISVDSNGLVVEELYQIKSKLKLVYITPSHQDPTGVIMSVPRRLELLKWAKKTGAFILEDDFDSEYHYSEKQVPSLQGLDEHGTVIYQSSFWKVLCPIVRTGFLLLPASLVEPVRRARGAIERDLPLLEQVALTEFVNRGLLELQVRRLRSIYARKRAALLHVLALKFKDLVTTGGVSAGMHMLIRFDQRFAEEDVLAHAKEAGVPMVSSKNHYLSNARSHEFIIDFTHSDESNLGQVMKQFADRLLRDTNLS